MEEKITWVLEKTTISHTSRAQSQKEIVLVVIASIGYYGLFAESVDYHVEEYKDYNKRYRIKPKCEKVAIDLTSLYKNFIDLKWDYRKGYSTKEAMCPMVELSTRISNRCPNNIILFDITFYRSVQYFNNVYRNRCENKDYQIPITILLKERPGLNRITYSAFEDNANRMGVVRQICDRALYQKDALVNKSLQFVVDKSPLTPLFCGHKPMPVMIDSRSEKQFAKVKANKDKNTLMVKIFKTLPVLER